jgi:hypothetical protein
MTTPPKRPAAASPQGATPAARQNRFRGVCLIKFRFAPESLA